MKRLVLVTAFLVAACGGKTPTTTAPTGTGSGSDTGSAAVAVLPDLPFEKLDHDQQIQFMKETVVPTMGPLFKAHDAKKYAEFGCKTCHGEGADKGEYDMPNAGLVKLDFSPTSTHKKEDLEWMGKEIKPTMAKLLRETPSSESNPTGFGCFHCHTPVGK